MTTLSPNYTMRQPRNSSETERRHLLSESVTPSAAPSIYSNDDTSTLGGDTTPRANTPTPSIRNQEPSSQIPSAQAEDNDNTRPCRNTTQTLTPSQQPYRGFASAEQYLAALHEWAEEKRYVNTSGTELVGFYGAKTLSDYADRPPLVEIGLRRKWRARRERKAGEAKERDGKARRGTVG